MPPLAPPAVVAVVGGVCLHHTGSGGAGTRLPAPPQPSLARTVRLQEARDGPFRRPHVDLHRTLWRNQSARLGGRSSRPSLPISRSHRPHSVSSDGQRRPPPLLAKSRIATPRDCAVPRKPPSLFYDPGGPLKVQCIASVVDL